MFFNVTMYLLLNKINYFLKLMEYLTLCFFFYGFNLKAFNKFSQKLIYFVTLHLQN